MFHCSAMEEKLHSDYLHGRPFGGTSVLCKSSLACTSSLVIANNPRCCVVKLSFRHCNDMVVVSVYMPCVTGSLEQDMEYENVVGCLQAIVDCNRGCNFVFGGDFNISKHHEKTSAHSIRTNFCYRNNIV